MADITVTTDFSQVNELNAAIDRTSVIFAKTVATIVREQRSMERAIKASAAIQEEATSRLSSKMSKDTQDWLQAQRRKLSMMAESDKMAQKQAASEAKLTAELAKQRIEAEKAGSVRSPIQQRIEGATGISGGSSTSAGASASAMGAEIERLRMKYDQVYASSNLYEKSLAELSRAHMLGVTSTKQHEAAVESLNLEYQNFQNGVAQAGNRFSQYAAQSASRMSQFGVVTQQAGYQIGDFLVQVQSGTNWMVAFGQQATQLVGVLPLMGAGFMGLSMGALVALSAGLGIAIPLVTAIGAAFMRTGEDANSASGGLSKYQQALDGVKGSLESLQTEINKLQFGEEDPVIANARKALEEAQNKLLLAQSSQRRIGNAIVPTTEELANLREATISYYELARTLAELVNKSEAHAEAQRMLNGYMSVSAGYVKAFTENLVRQSAAAEKVKQAHADQVVYMGKTRQESDNFVASLKSAYIELGNSKRIAAGLADEMTRAASASFALAQQNLAAGGLVYSGRGGNPATVNQQGGAFVYEGPPLDANNVPVISGGGGGGGEPTESALEKFQKQLDLEKELLNTTETYQKVRSALGDEFEATSPKVIEGLMQQATEIENLTRLEEERQSLMDSVNGSLENGFIAMVKGTQTVGEAFRSMAAAIIEELFRVLVVQKLVGGITNAVSGAFGGGTFTNTAGLTGGGRASGGSMMSGNSYLVGENGPEIVIPRHSGTVLNANQTSGAMAGSGGFTQNLSINVSGSDAAMVRQEVAKMIPQITNATKAAVIDAKQRGGQMAAAFR